MTFKWWSLFVFLIILLFGWAVLFYVNKPILSSPEDGPFEVEDTMAPVGATLPGINSVNFNNGIYTLTYSEGGNVLTQYEIDTNSISIQRGIFSVRESISEQITGTPFYPVREAGTRYKFKDPTIANPLWPTFFVSQLNPQITFTHSLSNGIIELRYLEIIPTEEVIIEKHYLVEIKGKTLVLKVEALNPPTSPYGYYQDFVFVSNQIPNPSNIALSYAEFAPIIIGGPLENRHYLTTYLDYTLTNSVNWPVFQRFANPLSNSYVFAYAPNYAGGIEGNYNPLSETFYITLSNNINDVLPKINRPPAQYRNELNNRIPLELWNIYGPPVLSSSAEKPFDRASTKIIDVLHSYGFEDLLVTLTGWRNLSQSGTTTCYGAGPIGYPANAGQGGSEKMIRLSRNAQDKGYLFGLYQIYTDMFTPGIWEPENLVLERDGNWRNYGWISTHCPPVSSPTGALIPQPLVIKPDKWMHYARLDAPLIKQNYNVNTAFLDVHQKLVPSRLIDYDPNPFITARSPKEINQLVNSLLTYLRDQVSGPIVGEGGSNEGYPTDTLHAGFIEGVEGEGVVRRNGVERPLSPHETPVIPDFELTYIKPLMVRFGMGYANRWTKAPDGAVEPRIDILTYPWDKYMATQFAFGHGGYLNDEFLFADSCFGNTNPQCWGSSSAWSGNPTQYEIDLAKNIINLWVKQYYNSKAIQELYLPAEILEIKYLSSLGTLVPLSGAIDQGTDFYNPKIYLKYQDDTEVWINRDQTAGNVWTVVEDEKTYYLPSNSWLGINPSRNFIQYSALVDFNGNPDINGHRVDYVRSNDYIMANGRGTLTNFGNGFNNNPLDSLYLTVVKPDGWVLLEDSSGGFSVTTPPLRINQLNPNSFPTSSNPPWITVTRAAGETEFVETFGIALRHQGTQWGGSLYCYDGPIIAPGGLGTCEFIDVNTIRFKVESNIAPFNYEVKYVDYSNPSSLIESNVVPLTVTVAPSCGDDTCNSGETCTTCSQDCGTCPGTTGTGTGGSGGSGGSGGGNSGFIPGNEPQCSDGIDNDGDDLIDYPEDLGCNTRNGNSEEDTGINEEDIEEPPIGQIDYLQKENNLRIILWSSIILLICGIIVVGIMIIRAIGAHRKLTSLKSIVNQVEHSKNYFTEN